MDNGVTSDVIILDNCLSWYNLNRWIIEDAVEDAWILRLPLGNLKSGVEGKPVLFVMEQY